MSPTTLIAIGVCLVTFIACFAAMRRAVWSGVAVATAVGYVYGIVRANIDHPIAQFVYDAALAGGFLAAIARPLSPRQKFRLRRLFPWVICLAGWPTLLLLVPAQNPLIQLVGWRGAVLFVPFILLGAMVEEADVRLIARSLAIINLAVFLCALAEVVMGVPRFYPPNALDAIIYNSTDVYVGGVRHYRIPATFANSASYASNMVASMPLLLGALSVEPARSWGRRLMLAASAASAVGVFLAASRSAAAMLILMVVIVSFSGRLVRFPRMAWIATVALIAVIVVMTPRLQRFLTLGESGLVAERVHGSVNESLLALVEHYPLGNGLGGGGTSIPYFLRPLLKNPIGLENEYARIVAEQGLPGLVLWLAFIGWILTRPAPLRADPWYSGRWLAWLFCALSFATAPLGTGLLDAIPQTATMLMLAGWIAAPQTDARRRVRTVGLGTQAAVGFAARHA
jgi:hypothetical protein